MTAANAPFHATALENERRAHEPSMEEILASIRKIIADDDALPLSRASEPRIVVTQRPFENNVTPLAPPESRAPVVAPEFHAPEDHAPELHASEPQAPELSAPEVHAPEVHATALHAPELHAPHAEPLGENIAPPVERDVVAVSAMVAPPVASVVEESFEDEAEPDDADLAAFAQIARELAIAGHGEPQDHAHDHAHDHAQDEAQGEPMRLRPSIASADEPVGQAEPVAARALEAEAPALQQPRAKQPAGDLGMILSAETNASVASAFQALSASVQLANPDMIERHVREMLRPMLKQWLDDNLPVMVERMVRAEIERVARGGR